MKPTPHHETLLHAFAHWETATPDNVYLTQPFPDGDVVDYSWREVGDQVRRMAAHLRSLALPEQSHIVIVGKNSAHWIMADLAIALAGHVTVPMFPTVNAETAAHVLEHSEARLIFVGKMDGVTDTWEDLKHGIPDALPRIALPMSPLTQAQQWTDIVSATDPLVELREPAPNDLATIIYTSGSTGRPKGVMHSFGTMIVAAQGLQEQFGLTAEDRMLSYLPLAHVAERAAVGSASLYFGFHVFFAEKLDTFQADLKRARPTLFFSVPRLWTRFYQAIQQKLPPQRQRLLFALPIVSGLIKRRILAELGLDQVRIALTGSAPLAPGIIRWYRGLGLELLDVYGMTENFAYSHAGRPGATRSGYIGESVPGVETRIADNGEIEVKSPGQMMGYYKMPEQTAADMTEDGYFKTGDMGEIDDQGRLKITGRIKDLFKTSKGKYVAPVPIENRLNNHPDIEVACVTGGEQPQPFALLLAAEEIRANMTAETRERLQTDFTQLLQQVNAQLDPHEKLAFVVVVSADWTIENGSLTPTMKIKRNVIEAACLPHAAAWYAQDRKVVWQ